MIIVPDDPGRVTLGETLNVAVTKIFDGDGFLAKVWHPGRRSWIERIPVRFAFIDAPEMAQPGGAEARHFLSGLIAGKLLRLVLIGKESTGFLPIDPYKRLLSEAYLTEQMAVGRVQYYYAGKHGTGLVRKARPVTRNVELEMIVNGWAWVAAQYTFYREVEYFAAQHEAQHNRRGLWAMDNPEPPWNFKRRQRRRNRGPREHSQLI